MNRREVLRGVLGVTVAGGLWPADGLGREASKSQALAPAEIKHAYLVAAESGWLSAEVQMGTQDLQLDKASYALNGLYWSEEPQAMKSAMVMGYFGAIVPSSRRTSLDYARWGSSMLGADHLWVVGLQSFELPGERISRFAVFSELSAKTSLAVLRKPSVVAAYDILDQSVKLRPYTDCRLAVVSDHPWNRLIEGSRRSDGKVPKEDIENKFRRIVLDLCDTTSKTVINAFERQNATGYFPSDVVRAYRSGWD